MCRIFAGQDRAVYAPEARSLRLNGHGTSLRLEAAFWAILDEIAASQRLSTPVFISKLHDEVLELHGEAQNFSSLLRCACLVHVAQQGHAATKVAAE